MADQWIVRLDVSMRAPESVYERHWRGWGIGIKVTAESGEQAALKVADTIQRLVDATDSPSPPNEKSEG